MDIFYKYLITFITFYKGYFVIKLQIYIYLINIYCWFNMNILFQIWLYEFKFKVQL